MLKNAKKCWKMLEMLENASKFFPDEAPYYTNITVTRNYITTCNIAPTLAILLL